MRGKIEGEFEDRKDEFLAHVVSVVAQFRRERRWE